MTVPSGVSTTDPTPPRPLDSTTAKLLRIAEIAVQHSGGHLRLAFNEEDQERAPQPEAAQFLKFDESRLGRDIKIYGFMGEVMGWEVTLTHFLEEVILPLQSRLPESYANAGEALRTLGETIYTEDKLAAWRELF